MASAGGSGGSTAVDFAAYDSGTHWWINFCKGNYYVEVRMWPSYGPAPDYTPSDAAQKKAAMDFAVAVAAKM